MTLQVEHVAMSCESILVTPRGVTSRWHLQQVKRLLDFDAGRHLDTILIYAAVELRCAIERYLCELLLLLRSGKVTKEDERQCRKIGGVFELIKAEDPHYRKTIEFTNIIASMLPALSKVKMTDTSRMHHAWSELSEFCHRQLAPEQTFESVHREYQEKGFSLLNDTLSYLSSIFNGVGMIMSRSMMEPEVQRIYDDFVQGRITGSDARDMLRIAAPVLAARRGLI